MTTTHIEYKTDRYVRSKSNSSKGKKYYQVRAPESFVVLSTENGYYKVAYTGNDSGVAYVKKAHFK